MSREFTFKDIWEHGFVHSRIYEFEFLNNSFHMNFSHVDLMGGSIIDCNIDITGWLDFKFYLCKEDIYLDPYEINNFYKSQGACLFAFEFDNANLVLHGCGIDDFEIHILKPKIKITYDEYCPDDENTMH